MPAVEIGRRHKLLDQGRVRALLGLTSAVVYQKSSCYQHLKSLANDMNIWNPNFGESAILTHCIKSLCM